MALFAMLFNLTGCAFVDGFKKGFNDAQQESEKKVSTKIVKSSDGKCQVSLPDNWTEIDKEEEDATIEQQSKDKDLAFMCIPISKEDLTDGISPDKVKQLLISGYQKNLSEVKIANEKDVTINGKSNKYFEVTGKSDSDNDKFTYYVSVVEGKDCYYESACFTFSSKTDKMRNDAMKIIKTFKEI